MKITLEIHGCTYSTQQDGHDYTADELKEVFSRLLVSATFPPSVIEDGEGSWEYKYN